MPFCYLLSVCLAVLSVPPFLLSSFMMIFIVICFEYSLLFFLYVFFFMIEDLHKISCSYRLLYFMLIENLASIPLKRRSTLSSCHMAFCFCDCVHPILFTLYSQIPSSASVVARYYNFHVIHCIFSSSVTFGFFNDFFYFLRFYFLLKLLLFVHAVFLILLNCLSALL